MTASLDTLLDALFPRGHAIDINDSVLTGSATTEIYTRKIVGSVRCV